MKKYSNPTHRPIKSNRYYICRSNPPTHILDQPLLGFKTSEIAEAYLAGMFYKDYFKQQIKKYKIVHGSLIQK